MSSSYKFVGDGRRTWRAGSAFAPVMSIVLGVAVALAAEPPRVRTLTVSGKAGSGMNSSGPASIAFVDNGRALAIGYWDGMVKVWPLEGPSAPRVLRGPSSSYSAARQVTAVGPTVAAAFSDRIELFDLSTGAATRTITAPVEKDKELSEVVFSGDLRSMAVARSWTYTNPIIGLLGLRVSGPYVVPGGIDRRDLSIWDLTGERRLHKLKRGRAIAFSPDGQRLIVQHGWKEIRVIKTANGKTERTLCDDRLFSSSAASLSGDGRLLVSASKTGEVAIWDLETGRRTRTLPIGQEYVLRAALSPDNQLLAAVDVKGFGIWDLQTGVKRFELKETGYALSDIEFSPDGRTLALSCNFGTVTLIDLSSIGQ